MRYRRWVVGLVLLLAVAAVAGGAVRVSAERRLRAELALARRDLESGYPALAARRVAELERYWPGHSEVEFRLGVCENARGHTTEALAAWAKVPPGSEFAAKAAVQSATQCINTGRYRPAEAALDRALATTGDEADRRDLYRARSRLYRFEGRVADVRQTLRDSWALSDDRPALLRELWLLDTSPQPIQMWSRSLEKADASDDRVWLGRAVVATLSGDYEEARRWLDRCAQVHPDDPAVWRARYELALAGDDEPALWQAAAHVAADRFDPTEPLRVRAWLLARRSDRDAERAGLRALLEQAPAQVAALDRLAALEAAAGHREEADRLQRLKAKLDDAKNEFRKHLFDDSEMRARAPQFAELARTLGRSWDAWAWSTLAIRNASAPVTAGATPGPATIADRLTALGMKPESGLASVARVAAFAPTPPDFTDDAAQAGLARFVFDNGATPEHQTPETMSGGVGVLDYDGDGFLDVYAVQGGPLTGNGTGDHLFRNRGDGTFEDVTERSGIARMPRGYGHGVSVGDYDNDGHPDLFITRINSYALYHNRGDGTFEDVTQSAGLAGRRDTPSCAAFADLDGDGDLDLYVTHYMLWDPVHPRLCPNEKGVYFYCDPSKLDPAPDHVFRNDRGHFVDVTKEAGFTDPDGRGLGVLAADFDGDGRVDIYVANDGTANYLFLNRGHWRFEEVGHAAGVAGNAEGGYQASMGTACGDVDGDGRPDIIVTNFYGEASTYYQNLGHGLFADRTGPSGLGTATRYLLGFGTSFLDYDNDGVLDLLTTNGHVNDDRPFYPYSMPTLLLAGGREGRFLNVSAHAGGVWPILRVGRGLAVGDIDNDGRIDAVILPQNDPLVYLHNHTRAGRWLILALEGTTSNRDAVGAVVTVATADGHRYTAWRFGGGSYQSARDPRLHFGLGAADAVRTVEIRWPAGGVETFRDLPVDSAWHILEGIGTPQPLAGYKH